MSSENTSPAQEVTPIERRKCFIISPFGGDDSDIRKKAYGLIEAVVKPVLRDLDFDAESSLDMASPGSINNQVISRLINDDLVIANLTRLNPNVMYELAVRHAIRKPVVCLIEKGTDLPFDIAQERTVFYTDDMLGVFNLMPQLKEAVLASLKDKDIDNPIYRAFQQSIIQEHVKSGSLEDLLLKRLDEIESKIAGSVNTNYTGHLELFRFIYLDPGDITEDQLFNIAKLVSAFIVSVEKKVRGNTNTIDFIVKTETGVNTLKKFIASRYGWQALEYYKL